MRPPIDEGAILTVCEIVPEFTPHYEDLRDIYGEDLTPETVFMELADVVTNLVISDQEPELLWRYVEAVEEVAGARPDDADLVGLCFLNLLPPQMLSAIEDGLGDHTRAVLERLECGWPDRWEPPASGAVLSS